MKRLLFSFLILFSLVSYAQTTMRIEVREMPTNCQAMVPKTCLQYRVPGEKTWSVFSDRISGFVYQAGFVYTLDIIQTERPKPVPADLSNYIYKLDKIVSMKVVPTSSDFVRWDVVRLNGKEVNVDQLYLQFDSTFIRISGKSGCNLFSGAIQFNKKNTKVKTNLFMSTKMACENDRMQVENEFMQAISNRKFKLKVEDGLWIWSSKGKEILALKSVPVHFIHPIHPYGTSVMPSPIEKPSNLEDRSAVDYFQGKELRVIQLKGISIENSNLFMTFDFQNGRFTGKTGCNSVGGSLQYDGERIIFSQVFSTKMACLDPAKMDREKEMISILNAGDVRYDGAEVTLNLYLQGELVMMLVPSKVKATE